MMVTNRQGSKVDWAGLRREAVRRWKRHGRVTRNGSDSCATVGSAPGPQQFCGADGNLLVEDLPYDHEMIEEILNGTCEPQGPAEVVLPPLLWAKYPQLLDEQFKREHRKACRARLEAKRSALIAQCVIGEIGRAHV